MGRGSNDSMGSPSPATRTPTVTVESLLADLMSKDLVLMLRDNMGMSDTEILEYYHQAKGSTLEMS